LICLFNDSPIDDFAHRRLKILNWTVKNDLIQRHTAGIFDCDQHCPRREKLLDTVNGYDAIGRVFDLFVGHGFIGLGYLGMNEFLLPLPVREEQFLELNNSDDTPSFTDLSIINGVDDVQVNCVLTSDNPDQLSWFWLRDSGSFQWDEEAGTLRLMLWQAFQDSVDDLTIQRLRALSGGSPWRLSITLPGAVLSTNRGVRGNQPNQLILELDFNEVIIENNTIYWEITWQT